VKLVRVRFTRSTLLRALATLTLAGALSATGLAPASAAANHRSGTGAAAHTAVAATTAKPAPTAPTGIPVGRTSVPKPHNSARTVRPLTPWTVSLTASPSSGLWNTEYSTITATTNQDVGPTAYYILIYQMLGNPTLVADCGSGSTCSVSETGGVFCLDYVAYIAEYDTTAPPPAVQAESNTIDLCWQQVGPVGLSAAQDTLPVGDTTTLTATTDVNIGPSPFYDQIWDTTATPPTLLNQCGSGTSCSISVTQSAATTHSYVATVGDYATSYPPPSVQSTSPTTYVTWNDSGWTVSISASDSSPLVTATASSDVGPTPYYIYIVDEDGSTLAQTCGTGATCTVSENEADIPMVAFVASGYSTTAPPANIVASSNTVFTSYELIQ
jgi:hypothetical protein